MSEELDSRQRRHLKGLAHSLDPVVQVGSAGASDAVVRQVDEALERHELIKVKAGKGYEGELPELWNDLVLRCDAALCQSIGRVGVLYRGRDRDLPGKPRIELPGPRTRRG